MIVLLARAPRLGYPPGRGARRAGPQRARSPGKSMWAAAIPRLGSALASRERPLVLVLDDAHWLHSRDSLGAVSALVDHVPQGSLIVVVEAVFNRVCASPRCVRAASSWSSVSTSSRSRAGRQGFCSRTPGPISSTTTSRSNHADRGGARQVVPRRAVAPRRRRHAGHETGDRSVRRRRPLPGRLLPRQIPLGSHPSI